MPIKYDKLSALLKSRGSSMYKLSTEKVIGNATREKLLGKKPGHIDTRTIETICEYLHCQPGDIMEYVPEDKTAGQPPD